MKKKIYISLPITGREKKAREHADLVKAALSRQGWEAISPFDIYAGKQPTYGDYLGHDIAAMLNCDAVMFCNGFASSCGCRIEHEVLRLYNRDNKEHRVIVPHYESPELENLVRETKTIEPITLT